MDHEETDKKTTEIESSNSLKAPRVKSEYEFLAVSDDEKRRNRRGGTWFLAVGLAWSLAVWLYSHTHPFINFVSVLETAVPMLIVGLVTVIVFSKVMPWKKGKPHVETWLFVATLSWPVLLLVCGRFATTIGSQLMGFLVYTGSPVFAAIIAGIAAHYYPASRRFLKWLAAMILLVALGYSVIIYMDSLQHGFWWLQGTAASPVFWLFVDLVVLSMLYLVAPERTWRQSRRTVVIILALLLAVSLGGFILSLSGKGAVRLQTGYDMVAQIKAGNIQREHVPDFVLNGTDAYTVDFSGTATLEYVGNTRMIYADTTLPGPAPRRVTAELYLCRPLSSRATKLADGTIAYGGAGYPQLVKGRSYYVTGVLEKEWQVSPRIFIPSPANIREQRVPGGSE